MLLMMQMRFSLDFTWLHILVNFTDNMAGTRPWPWVLAEMVFCCLGLRVLAEMVPFN